MNNVVKPKPKGKDKIEGRRARKLLAHVAI